MPVRSLLRGQGCEVLNESGEQLLLRIPRRFAMDTRNKAADANDGPIAQTGVGKPKTTDTD